MNVDPSLQHHLSVLESTLDKAVQAKGVDYIAQGLFQRFFSVYPETQEYFKDTDIPSFAPRKFAFIKEFLIDVIKHPDYFETEIINEVVRHTAYGLKDKEYYFALIDAFHDAIKDCIEDQWDEDVESCWQDITMGMKSNIAEASKEYIE